MAITLSEDAAERVRKFLMRRSAGVGLRMRVKTTGCSGFAYVVQLADGINPDDQVYESHDVRIVVDPKSVLLLDGTRIDFTRNGLNEGFKYDNPNVLPPLRLRRKLRSLTHRS